MMTFLAMLVVLACCFVLAFFVEQRNERRLQEKWPAIDDDEFVRRCPPGTRRETALKVRRIISEQLGVPYENIYPEQSFANDLGAE